MDLNKYCQEQDDLLKMGKISESEWYKNHRDATAESYLSRDTPWAQCGHGGTRRTWIESRILPLLETLHKDGSFIDIGCAVGYICESMEEWTKYSPFKINYFGMDICEELVSLAKKRMPHNKDNFFVGNVDDWIPPRKFDYVRIYDIDFVPDYKRKNFLNNLFLNYVNDGGRLIIGSYTEEKGVNNFEEKIRSLGFSPSGYSKRSYGNKERKILWFDKQEKVNEN